MRLNYQQTNKDFERIEQSFSIKGRMSPSDRPDAGGGTGGGGSKVGSSRELSSSSYRNVLKSMRPTPGRPTERKEMRETHTHSSSSKQQMRARRTYPPVPRPRP
jgi:hypothetical protein